LLALAAQQGRCEVSRPNSLQLRILVLAILLAAAPPAVANPVIGCALFTHVQPYDQDAPPIVSCSELVTHVTDTGWVDFEIYAYQIIGPAPYGIDECSFEFTWPAEWYFDEGWYPIPHGGAGTVSVVGNHAWVDVAYPGCPTTPGDLFLLLRLSFWVEGYGELAPEDYDNSVHFCQPNWGGASYMLGYGAQAGVVCDYGYADCDETWGCQPDALSPLLELQVNQGDTAVRSLDFVVQGNCQPVFAVTEPWMSIAVGQPNADDHYPVTLTVNTAGLALGEHEGYVSATDHGAACTLVALTVLDLTGVETTSWSRIKSLY
jgi:hypothetical protein